MSLQAEQFLDQLLESHYADLRTLQADNYDWDRFSYDGVDRSDIPYTALHKEALIALVRDPQSFYEAYVLLGDEASRTLYLALLRYRLAGHKHVRLPTNNPAYWSELARSRTIPFVPSALDIPNFFGFPFQHYTFDFEGCKLHMDGVGLYWPFFARQYFYERDSVRIRPERGDHVIDAGACLGDTSLAFGAAVGTEGAVYAFELLAPHLRACAYNFEQNPGLSNFKTFSSGLDERFFVPAQPNAADDRYAPGFKLAPNSDQFPTTTLDALVASGEIPRVDFIKMDIEGAELRALRGARETLQRFRPKLAISIYHEVAHFHEIVRLIDSFTLGYKFHLDHYSIHAAETVLYAAVPLA